MEKKYKSLAIVEFQEKFPSDRDAKGIWQSSNGRKVTKAVESSGNYPLVGKVEGNLGGRAG